MCHPIVIEPSVRQPVADYFRIPVGRPAPAPPPVRPPVPAPAPDPARPTGEAALLRRMAAGDERALGELYERWSRPVHATVLGIVGDPGNAEEIVEATFWQAWRQAARYEPSRGAVSTWLITIGRSRALDLLRARKRGLRWAHDGEQRIDDLPAPAAADDPALHAEAGERRRLVRGALGELPPEQRHVVELAYFRGLSQTEIAERTGLPLGTVKTRIRLAMRKLRVRLRVLHDEAA